MDRELRLKLVIDGNEAVATINTAEGEAKELVDTLQNIRADNVKNVTKDVEALKPALDDAGKAGDELGYNLGKDFDGIYVTTQDLIDRLDDLKTRIKDVMIGGEEYNYLSRQINEVSSHLKTVKTDLTVYSDKARVSTLNTAVFREGIYSAGGALRNISPALGNVVTGLTPFINGVSVASIKGQGFKAALSMVSSQLMGPLGLGLAITGVALLFDKLIAQTDKAEKSTDRLTIAAIDAKDKTEQWKNAVKDLREELEKMTDDNLIDALKKSYGEVVKAQSEILQNMKETTFLNAIFGSAAGIDASIITKLTEALVRLNAVEDKLTARGKIPKLEAELKALETKKDEAQTDAEILKLNQQIETKKKDIERLNKLGVDSKKESVIQTDLELQKEIENVKLQLSKTTSLREQFLLKQKLLELYKEEHVVLRNTVDLLGQLVDKLDELGWNKNISAIDQVGINFAKGTGIGKSPFEITGDETAEEIDKKVKAMTGGMKPDPVKETNTELSFQLATTTFLDAAWQRAGSSMASALSRGLGLLRQTDNVLQNLIGSVLDLGLQMAISGIWGGLFSLIGGGGFSAGFMKAIGLADGGVVTKPTLAMVAERGMPEAVIPLDRFERLNSMKAMDMDIKVGGSFEMDGFKMNALVKRVEKIEKRYK